MYGIWVLRDQFVCLFAFWLCMYICLLALFFAMLACTACLLFWTNWSSLHLFACLQVLAAQLVRLSWVFCRCALRLDYFKANNNQYFAFCVPFVFVTTILLFFCHFLSFNFCNKKSNVVHVYQLFAFAYFFDLIINICNIIPYLCINQSQTPAIYTCLHPSTPVSLPDHPCQHDAFFDLVNTAQKHTLLTHFVLFLPCFCFPPCVYVYSHPCKPHNIHLRASVPLLAWSLKTWCPGKFPRP